MIPKETTAKPTYYAFGDRDRKTNVATSASLLNDLRRTVKG